MTVIVRRFLHIERRKRRNPIEKLFVIFLSVAFICVVIGVCSVIFFVLFADANYGAPLSEYSSLE